uniref:Bm1489 n=1 Tax=Brugia malayi TaxID=6279 RepID=A0A1I9G4M7_BRUMA|nr:Bm1489 [Brugia malayi]
MTTNNNDNDHIKAIIPMANKLKGFNLTINSYSWKY